MRAATIVSVREHTYDPGGTRPRSGEQLAITRPVSIDCKIIHNTGPAVDLLAGISLG